MDDNTFLTLGLALIAIGLLLLLADLFIASGALAVLALAAVVVGLVFVFRYDTAVGLVTLAGVFVGVPLAGGAILRFWPGLVGWRRGQDMVPDTTVAELAINQELAALKGRYGKTLSALRPAGVVDFDGRRVDSISEGMLIAPGQWVRCVDVQAGKVVVRVADRPRLEDLETAILK
jgi:membrane-bound serine protease (ClpP class)